MRIRSLDRRRGAARRASRLTMSTAPGSAALLLAAAIAAPPAAPGTPAAATGAAGQDSPDPGELAREGVIRRTEYGVPQLRAENLRAMGFGLAWTMTEDYGERVPRELLEDRRTLSRHFGPDSLDEGDVRNRRAWRRALEPYSRLSPDTRAVLDGSAAGVNRYVRTHPGEFPP